MVGEGDVGAADAEVEVEVVGLLESVRVRTRGRVGEEPARPRRRERRPAVPVPRAPQVVAAGTTEEAGLVVLEVGLAEGMVGRQETQGPTAVTAVAPTRVTVVWRVVVLEPRRRGPGRTELGGPGPGEVEPGRVGVRDEGV